MNTKIMRGVKLAMIIITALCAVWFTVSGIIKINDTDNTYEFVGTDIFVISEDALEEEYEDEKFCPVEFVNTEGLVCIKEYPVEEWKNLTGDESIEGYIYDDGESNRLAFPEKADDAAIKATIKDMNAAESSDKFGFGMAFGIVAIGIAVITFFGKHFTNYEQIWFAAIIILAAIFSILFPENEVNGVNGLIIMALYLADTFLNMLCELLISKQSKWNFIVSVFVELTEIAICIVLAYRFATLASTLFFWLPCDIISFINWHRHPDRIEDELTEVRTLKGWQEALIITGIVIWTIGVGYFLTTLDLGTDFFGGDRTKEIIVCYMDACVTAVAIVNGLFILLRLREQWIAWFIDALLEAAINIISGQFVLLVLKAGYITNSTYGYIKWTKYIKKNAADKQLQQKKNA